MRKLLSDPLTLTLSAVAAAHVARFALLVWSR